MKKIILFLSLFLIGCSTTTNLKLTDPTGREIPSPHYVLKSFQNNIVATFYYIYLDKQKDIDGTIINRPKYLPMCKNFVGDTSSELLLVIEISNPNKTKYKIWETINIEFQDKTREIRVSELAKSNLGYRQFMCKMPIGNEIKEVSYEVRMLNESDIPVMIFGDFHYKIKKKGGEIKKQVDQIYF